MMTYFEQLGITGYPLTLCSCIALAIILERFLFFVRTFALPRSVIEQILNNTSLTLPEEFKSQLQQNFFGFIVIELFEKTSLDDEEKASFFSLQLSSLEEQLSRFLQILKIIATISPLLGLFGTILGMIEAFDSISQVQGPVTPALVAGGISKALFTTAGGLLIAIPALLAHYLYQMRVVQLMKRVTQQMNLIHSHLQKSH